MSDHSGYPGAPPGWYQDPAGGPGQRWWDGYAWTEATVLPQQPPPPPPWAGAAPPQQAPRAGGAVGRGLGTAQRRSPRRKRWTTSERMVAVARFAVAMPGVYFLVSLLLQRANADQLRSAGHQFRIDFHDAQLGRTAPAYHAAGNSLAPIGLLVGVLTDRRRDHRLRLAAQGGVGRARPRHPARSTRRPGAWAVGSCRSSTSGCPTAPSATASRRDIRTGTRVLQWWLAWLLAWTPQRRGRELRPVLDGSRTRPGDTCRLGVPGRHRLGARHRGGHRGGPSGGLGRADRGNRGVPDWGRTRLSAQPRARKPRAYELFTSG